MTTSEYRTRKTERPKQITFCVLELTIKIIETISSIGLFSLFSCINIEYYWLVKINSTISSKMKKVGNVSGFLSF